jgi:hypothetical protein
MTRMWMVEPRLLCREHLFGEHSEIHQLVGFIQDGRINKLLGHHLRGQIDVTRIQERHDTLVDEIKRRGYDHNTPLDYDFDLPLGDGSPDVEYNRRVLSDRCSACNTRIKGHY